ncbi:Gfo/Idh/MocA family oxidoreductase [Anaerococcus sp. AGMB00486]|uniref:Gfo/Idh/MocA family oxidoreductase n=1 Tax=Anaerococcus faecalis TaxID=2742993 RepID=A0ABX2N9D3_9FIRM|nr:Gfo/Idh/MocA family oxidoreductase [Anaerococcus faecalis]NVF11127.1 Gfo/Idh/MocA family oxidoreductase [Anaerococcus faecalis]
MKLGVIGAGHRGRIAYARLLREYGDVEIKSFVDIDEKKLEACKKEFNIDDCYIFTDYKDFFEKMDEERFVDTLIIATPDRDHYDVCMKALDYDLNILLEKPISPNAHEVFNIAKKAKKKDRVFMICHVLRYSPFFVKIKELIDSNAIGRVLSINHNENIGYFHFAHSFVRGNWRNEDLSSPLILQKSCHDMDILIYLTGKKPKYITSFGKLSYFKKENEPSGAADRCLDCKYKDTCVFSVKDFYTGYPGLGWRDVVDVTRTKEGLEKALREGPYGRCVYKCDNNVCDHQAISIEFEDDVEVVFNLSAFSNDVHRNIKIMGTEGEIIADDYDQIIKVKRFKSYKEERYQVISNASDHGGADYGIIKAFYEACHGESEVVKTGAEESIMSHMMCFASEQARKESKVVEIDDFIRRLDE